MDFARIESNVLGGLYGVVVGDAMGVPYEFSDPQDLPPLERIELKPPIGFLRAHGGIPSGTWSDDGAQALCLLASLLQCGRLDLDDFARRLLRWYEQGYMAVDQRVFDVGMQTSAALSEIQRGVPVESAAPATEFHNGNGSLMRVLPLALWHTGSDEQLIEDAARQSIPTHPHVRAQIRCALHCLWARAVLSNSQDAWRSAVSVLRQACESRPAWRSELELEVRPDSPPGGKGSGYVVDCLHSARLALEEPTFERVIRRAISLGNDTDTTAAVAGGIAGIRFGLEGIPERWLGGLRGRSIVDGIAGELIADLRKRGSGGAGG